MSSSSASARVGRDLEEDRRPGRGGLAGGRHPRQQLGQLRARLHVAQAGRVGRGDVDGEVGGERGKAGHAFLVVGDAVGAVLVGADIDADDAGRPLRAASLRAAASWPSLLKPALMTASSCVSRKMRGFGLPGCGSGVIVPASAKPKPRKAARPAPRRSCRSRRMPSGWGSRARRPKPSAAHRAGRLRPRQAAAQRRDRQAVRRFGIEQEEGAPASRSMRLIAPPAAETRACLRHRAAAAAPMRRR